MNAGLTNIRPSGMATTVVRLSAGRTAAGRVENTGVTVEQRGPRPIAALLPQLLAKYGLNDLAASDTKPPRQLDLFA